MTRYIRPQHKASHKALVRKIANDINSAWRSHFKTFFSICDITNAYDDLWDDYDWNEDIEDVLDPFHCVDWKYIDDEARAVIVEHVIKLLDTPYLRYANGRFYMHDIEAIAAETSRKEAQAVTEAAKPRSKLLRWLDKLFGETE